LARQHAVDGYYVRVAEPDRADAASPCHGFVPIKNRPPHQSIGAAKRVILDALAFVRFGLRAADDPRIVSTVKVIDAMLRVETPRGPAWHRFQGDGDGEHADGGPFDGTGIGRAWPLLTGERAHCELAAGRMHIAERLAQAMEAFAGGSGSCPSRFGIATTVLTGHCSSGTHPARRCPWCGRTPSTSSCAGPSETERSSIGRLKRFNDTW
jgi:glucoamylase